MDKNNDKVLKIVVKHLQPCLNGNMQISDKVIEGIVAETQADGSFIGAIEEGGGMV